MPPLRSEQFGELASRLSEPDGGFSVRTTTGYEPSGGYMVSQAGTETKLNGSVTGNDLQAYSILHAGDLNKRSRYLGGWHDPKTGAKDLDVSRRYRGDEVGHTRAIQAMWRQNQDALYNLNDFHSEENYLKRGLPEHPIPGDTWLGIQKNLGIKNPTI